QQAPWLGYLLVVERSEKSTAPVRLNEPHFPVMKEFKDTSYLDRYQLFCQKLLLERHYSAASLFWTENESSYEDYPEEISFKNFVGSFGGYLQGRKHEF
ncbi:PaeR7I family type II restriction endonuclease, partial [Arthrospira platensis SPKY1]|nr:PaeR7I family type II restriction endonuclease [Arthrospira platensis SPKY1]